MTYKSYQEREDQKVSWAKEIQEGISHKPRLSGQAGVYVGSSFLLLWSGCLMISL